MPSEFNLLIFCDLEDSELQHNCDLVGMPSSVNNAQG